MLHYIKKNSQDTLRDFDKDLLSIIGESFKIACLLHDCAHAPFSHTLENLYEYGNHDRILESKLKGVIDNDNFNHDYIGCGPSEHEKASAYVAYRKWSGLEINGSKIDMELVARMIIGCPYGYGEDVSIRNLDVCVKNAFISLLNSPGVDVDKLDYIRRDTWASGISNVNIDIHRLLSSLSIVKDPNTSCYKLVFDKSCISVINSVFQARNYINEWIYAHHKVVFYNNIVKLAAEELFSTLNNEFKMDNSQKELFDCDKIFFNNKSILSNNGINVSLLNDGDLQFLFKLLGIQIFKSYSSRDCNLKSLWKSHVEFYNIRNMLQNVNVVKLKEGIDKELPNFLNAKKYLPEYITVDVNPNILAIERSEINIWVNNEVIPYANLMSFKGNSNHPVNNFIYLYVDKNMKFSDKQIIINEIIQPYITPQKTTQAKS